VLNQSRAVYIILGLLAAIDAETLSYTYQVIIPYFCDIRVVKYEGISLGAVLFHPRHISRRRRNEQKAINGNGFTGTGDIYILLFYSYISTGYFKTQAVSRVYGVEW
jgi:hypothetical protein